MKLPTKLTDLKALAAKVEEAIKSAKVVQYKPGDRIYLGGHGRPG